MADKLDKPTLPDKPAPLDTPSKLDKPGALDTPSMEHLHPASAKNLVEQMKKAPEHILKAAKTGGLGEKEE